MNSNGNYQQSEQNWQFQDGNTNVKAHFSQSSWSSNGQATIASAPMQPLPAMAIQAPSFSNMHQQLHANVMAHHQSAINHISNVQRSMQSSLFLTQPPIFPQIGFSQPPVQQQMQLPAPPVQNRNGPNVEELESSDDDSDESDESEESSSEEDNQVATYQQQQHGQTLALEQRMASAQQQQDAEHRLLEQRLALAQQQQSAQQQANEARYAADQQRLDAQRLAMEQRYAADQQNVQRQGAVMNDRLRKLEEKETKNNAEREAKDREMRQLRDENNQLNQQRFDDAEKHTREMADLARMQASKPQASATVFDTSALEKIIREVQSQQLSKSDIEKVIQERVASQLDGLAKKKDIEAAGSKMRKALQQVPAGASIDEINLAVNQQLGRAVDKLGSKMQAVRPRIESTPAAPQLALPASAPVPQMPEAQHDTKPHGMLAQLSGALVKSGKSKGKDKEVDTPVSAAVPQPIASTNATPLVAPITQHTDYALTKVKKDKKSSKTLEQPFQPQLSTQAPMLPLNPSTGSGAMPTSAPQSRAAPAALATLPHDFPDNASQITSWERNKAPMSSAMALPTVAETQPMEHALVKKPKQGSSSPAVATPAQEQALIKKSKKSKAESSNMPLADQALVKKSKHSKTAASAEATSSDSLVRKSKHDKTTTPVVTGNVTIADILTHMSNMPLPIMSTSFELPEDFPDNASQISAWERRRAAPAQAVLTGSAVPAQIQAATANAMGGQDLVRSSKSKKHGSGK